MQPFSDFYPFYRSFNNYGYAKIWSHEPPEVRAFRRAQRKKERACGKKKILFALLHEKVWYN